MIITLTKQDVDSDPNLIWNSYVKVLARPYEHMLPAQRPAHLVFAYENEVYNGGHLQFFENGGGERLEETISALTLLQAHCHRTVLIEAGEVFFNLTRSRPTTVEEFVAAAEEEEFTAYDSRFHDCSPTLQDLLTQHLEDQQSSFVMVI